MIGISSNGKSSINKIVEDIFDRIALQFIGDLPRLKEVKRLIISTQPNLGLPHLFVQAMANKPLNEIEKDVLKSLLESSDGYIQALKNRTRASLTDQIDGTVRQAKLQNRKVTKKEIDSLVEAEFKKAGSSLMTILEAEGTKFRNLGSMMDISRVAASIGDPDPTVFFIMVRDNTTCKECLRLHTSDGITPRLFKFSELKQGYHKRGEDTASIYGLHPHCRCTLAYLSKGFGFDEKGKLKYHSPDHDAYEIQSL